MHQGTLMCGSHDDTRISSSSVRASIVGVHAKYLRMRPPTRGPSQFQTLRASELFCPRCRSLMPVRERLLLVLPDGDLYEYRCAACGESVGKRQAGVEQGAQLVLPR